VKNAVKKKVAHLGVFHREWRNRLFCFGNRLRHGPLLKWYYISIFCGTFHLTEKLSFLPIGIAYDQVFEFHFPQEASHFHLSCEVLGFQGYGGDGLSDR